MRYDIATSGLGEIAGEIGGVRALEYDIRRTAYEARRLWPTVRYDDAAFRAVLQRASAGRLDRMTGAEAQQFVLGNIEVCAKAIAQMKQIALLDSPNAANREANQALQARLLAGARRVWADATVAIRDARVEAGTAGLGNPILIASIVLGSVLIVSLVAGGVYYAANVQQTEAASREAAERCREWNQGRPCDAAQLEAFRRAVTDPTGAQIFADRFGVTVGTGVGVGVGLLIVGTGIYFGVRAWRRRRGLDRRRSD